MSRDNESCLSLVHDGEVQVVSFWNTATANDLKRIVAFLQDSQVVQEVHFRHIQIQDQLLSPFAKAIRSHPTMKRLTFYYSSVENFVAMFAAMTADDHPLPALEFHQCVIHSEAAEALNLMLQSGIIHELVIDQCLFDQTGAASILAAGLEQNQSLRSFTYCGFHEELSLMNAITIMLARNPHVQCLCLDLHAARYHGHLMLHTLETGPSSLKRLQIRGSYVLLETMEHILQLCMAIKSITELDFTKCVFEDDALLLLTRTLSEHVMVRSLDLSDIQIMGDSGSSCWTSCPTIVHYVVKLQVQRLVLSGESLGPHGLIQEIALAKFIQHLDLGGFTEYFHYDVCDSFRQQSSGPFELIMDQTLKPIPMIVGSNGDPTSRGLMCVTWRHAMEDVNLVELAKKMVDMPGLRRLTLRHCEDFAAAQLIPALAKSLEHNQSLCTLSLHGLPPATSAAIHKHAVGMRCALALNRVGHFHLMECEEQVPASLWTHVLARSSQDPDGIFFVLRDNPDIVGR